MSKAKTTIVEPVDMLRLERERSSHFGNPRFRIVTADADYLTAPDAAVGYDMDNWFHWQTDRNRHSVRLTLNGRGHVVNVEQS